MKALLDKSENTPNSAAHIVFFTDNTFSFTVPKAFALSVCRYIVKNTFDYRIEFDISIIPLINGIILISKFFIFVLNQFRNLMMQIDEIFLFTIALFYGINKS